MSALNDVEFQTGHYQKIEDSRELIKMNELKDIISAAEEECYQLIQKLQNYYEQCKAKKSSQSQKLLFKKKCYQQSVTHEQPRKTTVMKSLHFLHSQNVNDKKCDSSIKAECKRDNVRRNFQTIPVIVRNIPHSKLREEKKNGEMLETIAGCPNDRSQRYKLRTSTYKKHFGFDSYTQPSPQVSKDKEEVQPSRKKEMKQPKLASRFQEVHQTAQDLQKCRPPNKGKSKLFDVKVSKVLNEKNTKVRSSSRPGVL